MTVIAHLGLAEHGSAWADRDGDMWIVWPNGIVGFNAPLPVDVGTVTRYWGPFNVVAVGLPSHQCDALAAANGTGADKRALRALATGELERGDFSEQEHCARGEVESIDAPGSGLRWAAGGAA